MNCELAQLTDIYVDGDACPVREEIYRVASRLRLQVFVVSNGSRPIRSPGIPGVNMVLVGDSADAADDWIVEHIAPADVCVTADIPLAARCLEKGARVVSPTGRNWTSANIGNALAGRELARYLREVGAKTRGPAPLTKMDRSRFLSALDSAVQAVLREAAAASKRG
ncbi:MAG TPA: YaiI/YqxD family protein [Stellaceae bacterium]|nr:YaiI/YqxD family protein [Stellaceae bacterium]